MHRSCGLKKRESGTAPGALEEEACGASALTLLSSPLHPLLVPDLG